MWQDLTLALRLARKTPVATAGARLRGVLHDVSRADPIVFAAAPLVLLAVCAIASWMPAWTAIWINAAAALRSDQRLRLPGTLAG
jgi:hypothetical protein